MGDEEGLRKRGLPIEELMQLQGGTGGLSSGPPASGLEYLMQVRNEANACPQVVVARNLPTSLPDYSSTSTFTPDGKLNIRSIFFKQDPNHPDSKIDPVSASHLQVQQQWKDAFLLHFRKLREDAATYMSNPRVRASWTPVQMPPYSQDRNWKVFCYGLEEKEEEEGEEVNTSATGDSKDGNKRKRKRGYGENGEGYYPEYYILGQIDQRSCLSLLKYHIDWMYEDEITLRQAQWIFALLLRLDALLPSNDMFILRTICRQAQKLRYEMISHYPSPPIPLQTHEQQELHSGLELKRREYLQLKRMQDARIGSLNMIICIVTSYFGQSDLENETTI